MSTSQESPAEKVIRERKLAEAVIEESTLIHVDGQPLGSMPGEILVETERRLLRDPNEELTPHRVRLAIDDTVIGGGFGSFYWSGGKRHLLLNSEEWREKNRKKTLRPVEIGLGDLTGVYGDTHR